MIILKIALCFWGVISVINHIIYDILIFIQITGIANGYQRK